MVTQTATVAVPAENCTHYWEIEAPDGPTARGVCSRCHGEKFFDNSTELGGARENNSDIFASNGRSSGTVERVADNDIEDAVGGFRSWS